MHDVSKRISTTLMGIAFLIGTPLVAFGQGCNPYKERCPPSIEPADPFPFVVACNPYKELCAPDEVQQFVLDVSRAFEQPVLAVSPPRLRRE